MNKQTLTTLGITAFMASGMATAADNLVLVHGAHFAADSWHAITPHLKPETKVVAVDMPGRNSTDNAEKISLTDYAQVLCNSMKNLTGDIHIAAHSQGGAVANRALSLCPEKRVHSITYVTSVAPIEGQTAFELLNKQDYKNYMKSMTFNENSHRMQITNKELFAKYFAQDANAAQIQTLIKTAISEPAHIGDETMVLPAEALARVDKYYVFANQDQIISLESQVKIAGHINLKGVYALDTGHSPMLTQPQPLAEILNQIIEQ